MEKFKLELTQNMNYGITNYDELEKKLREEVEKYKVDTINEDTYKLAKANKAKLNKLVDEVNDTRIEAEKAYMLPFMQGKEQCNNLINIVKEVSSELDKGIKEVDERTKGDKYSKIKSYFDSINDLPIEVDDILNTKWLNKTTKFEDIQSEINLRLSAIKYDITQLKSLSDDSSFSFVLFLYIENNLDFKKALEKFEKYLTLQERLK